MHPSATREQNPPHSDKGHGYCNRARTAEPMESWEMRCRTLVGSVIRSCDTDAKAGTWMNKTELSARLVARTSISKPGADAAVRAVFSTIADALAGGGGVAIAGFGSFSTKSRPARQGRNPRTGEIIAIPPQSRRPSRPARPFVTPSPSRSDGRVVRCPKPPSPKRMIGSAQGPNSMTIPSSNARSHALQLKRNRDVWTGRNPRHHRNPSRERRFRTAKLPSWSKLETPPMTNGGPLLRSLRPVTHCRFPRVCTHFTLPNCLNS